MNRGFMLMVLVVGLGMTLYACEPTPTVDDPTAPTVVPEATPTTTVPGTSPADPTAPEATPTDTPTPTP